jgi:23S rRNA-/tRNA-specific pseudouridylate synthase
VIEQLRQARPPRAFLELVHRLDKETSGVLLLAKKRSALTALQDQFRARGHRQDLCRAGGAPGPKLKVIDVPLHKTLDAAASAMCARWRRPRRRPALDHAGARWPALAGPARCWT